MIFFSSLTYSNYLSRFTWLKGQITRNPGNVFLSFAFIDLYYGKYLWISRSIFQKKLSRVLNYVSREGDLQYCIDIKLTIYSVKDEPKIAITCFPCEYLWQMWQVRVLNKMFLFQCGSSLVKGKYEYVMKRHSPLCTRTCAMRVSRRAQQNKYSIVYFICAPQFQSA